MVLEAQRQLLQEIANGGIREPPSQYVHREEDRPTGAVMAADMVLPTVDVSRLVGAPDDHVDEAAKLRSALESWGLFVVTGHGIPKELLDGILGVTRDFFYLTPEEKLKYSNVIDGNKFQHEGYGIDRVDTNEQILDWCDRLYLKVQPEDERQLELWPSHPQFLTALLHEYTRKCEQVTKVVLGAMATGLGFTEEFFIDKVGERVTTFARFSYYPPCARPDLVYGVKPHTDNSVLSILLLDKDVGGLQVLKGETWVDVPVLGHDLLVLVGDVMEIMSNAVFKAPVHRVVTGDKERVSLVMFYRPDPRKDVEPAEELTGEKRPLMYKRLNARDFADGFWDAYAAAKRAIDFLKLRPAEHGAAA
ncbi:hypothetical protein PR202_ga25463 [Eleusine coracana subsp. coracana]|uniref:Fe2OG dioxygenase domain-containing protein n=1 Tax=Eleusine coracana subsp. coracana TaxID=191504 RepID=A0AAV5DAU8_ELECO|nr:hypothetical protein PR202_ga25403 [Eleusine coracana subsp. coracana]GJN07620.1 hypothetical protein PR202_ga25463 [Eleusine coracana subsp. coracana]